MRTELGGGRPRCGYLGVNVLDLLLKALPLGGDFLRRGEVLGGQGFVEGFRVWSQRLRSALMTGARAGVP